MIAKLEFRQENRKFVVRARNGSFYLRSSNAGCTSIECAQVYDSVSIAKDEISVMSDPEDWEVEQIVVC